jgi:hypothetical protein
MPTIRQLAMLQVLVCAGLATPVLAQSPGIPYQGRLELNGRPATGTHNVSFQFFDVQTGGTALSGPMARQVEALNGAFSTVLSPVPPQALDGRPVFLEITVEGNRLSGRQRLLAVPFAMGTAQGDNFVVTGRLGVGTNQPTTAITLGTGADGQGGTLDALAPQATIEIPIGDEAAGGLFLFDGQGRATQNAEVSYASSAQKLRLHNLGKGLRVDKNGHVETDADLTVAGSARVAGAVNVTGSLNVTGSVNAPSQGLKGCPADMERIGFWCIDTVAKVGTWGAAVDDCDARFSAICPLNAIMMCDEQNLGKGRGQSCGDLTDAGGAVVRTGDTHAPVDASSGAYAESVYDRLTCFNPAGNDVNTSGCGVSDSAHYFCCRPGLF